MGSLGAEKRHAGYVEWKPRQETLYWMQCVNEILAEYKAYWPLTIRQIFYRLVANYKYDKTENAYNRLINYLSRARRARIIPFNAIRDDGARGMGPGGYENVEEWLETTREAAASFDFMRMQFQPRRIEIFCEGNSMVPLLAEAVAEYGVSVYSGGGFNSLTTVRQTAQRITNDERDTIVFNFGDYDPSGESIFDSFRQDVEMFCDQIAGVVQCEFRRMALTQEQVDDMSIPTAPPKSTDSRSRNWIGDTAQLEAIPPDQLAQMAVDAVLSELDMEIHEDTVTREERIQERLSEEVERMISAVGDYDGSDDKE